MEINTSQETPVPPSPTPMSSESVTFDLVARETGDLGRRESKKSKSPEEEEEGGESYGDENYLRKAMGMGYDDDIDALLESERNRRMSRKKSISRGQEEGKGEKRKGSTLRGDNVKQHSQTNGEDSVEPSLEQCFDDYERETEEAAKGLEYKQKSGKRKNQWWRVILPTRKLMRDDSMPDDDDDDCDNDNDGAGGDGIGRTAPEKLRDFFTRVFRFYTGIPVLVELLFTMGVICVLWFGIGFTLGFVPILSGAHRKPTVELTEWQVEFLKHFHVAPTILSIVGSSVIIFCYFWFRSMRSFHLRLVLYLCISDLGLDASFLLQYLWKDFCFVQAAFSEYFPLASAWWTFMIAFSLIQHLVKSKKVKDIRKFEIFMFVWCWGMPLIFASLVLILDMGDQQLSWCWISAKFATWRFLFFYLVLFIIFIYNIIAYVFISFYAWRSLRKIKRLSKKSAHNRVKNIIKARTARMSLHFAYYILAFLTTWAAGLSHRVWNLISPNPVFFLLALHTFFTPATGILNCIAYGASYQSNIIGWIKLRLKLLLRFIFRKNKNILESKWLTITEAERDHMEKKKHGKRKIFKRKAKKKSKNNEEEEGEKKKEEKEAPEFSHPLQSLGRDRSRAMLSNTMNIGSRSSSTEFPLVDYGKGPVKKDGNG